MFSSESTSAADYVPLSERRLNWKGLVGVSCFVVLLVFLGLESEPGLQLRGYVEDEIFVSYMEDEEGMTSGEKMEEVYAEDNELMDTEDDLAGVHHVYDEEMAKFIPVFDITPQYTKSEIITKVNELNSLLQRELSPTQKSALTRNVDQAKSQANALSADNVNAVGAALQVTYNNFDALVDPGNPADSIGAALNIIGAIAPLAGPVGGTVGAFAGILSFGFSLFGGGGGGDDGMKAVVKAVQTIVSEYFERHRDIMVRGNIEGINRALIEMAGELSTSDMSSTSENCRDWTNSYVVDEMGVSLGIFYNAIKSEFNSNPDLSIDYLYYYCYMSTIRLMQLEQIHMLSLSYGEEELATRLEGRIRAIKNQDADNLRFDTRKNDAYSKTMDRIYWKGSGSREFKIIDEYRQICGLRPIGSSYSVPTVIGVKYNGVEKDSRLSNGPFYIRRNNKWVERSQKFVDVAISDDGLIWGVTYGLNVYQYQVKSNTWLKIQDRNIKQIDAGTYDQVWGVDRGDNIYRWDTKGKTWKNVAGRLQYVSVGADGTVWGIAPNNDIYRRISSFGGIWTKLPGKLNQLSVGSKNHIWGVKSNQEIYRWDSSQNKWQKISGKLGWICVSKTGSNIWGVTKNRNIIMQRSGNTWKEVEGKLMRIDCR